MRSRPGDSGLGLVLVCADEAPPVELHLGAGQRLLRGKLRHAQQQRLRRTGRRLEGEAEAVGAALLAAAREGAGDGAPRAVQRARGERGAVGVARAVGRVRVRVRVRVRLGSGLG